MNGRLLIKAVVLKGPATPRLSQDRKSVGLCPGSRFCLVVSAARATYRDTFNFLPTWNFVKVNHASLPRSHREVSTFRRDDVGNKEGSRRCPGRLGKLGLDLVYNQTPLSQYMIVACRLRIMAIPIRLLGLCSNFVAVIVMIPQAMPQPVKQRWIALQRTCSSPSRR